MRTAIWKKTLFNSTAIIGLATVLSQSSPSSGAININVEYVRRSVVFIYAADGAGNADPNKPLGTGFIIQVPKISDPGKAWKLLVTARHVVDPQWAQCPASATKLFMRVNKKNFDPAKEQVGTVDLELTGANVGSMSWFFSDDPDVDAAIIPIDGALLDKYDVDGIHMTDFPTPEEQKALNSGDAIISAGLFPGLSGKKRNYPLFKFGNISSISDEPAEAGCPGGQGTRLMKVWFVAANLAPGNSGSPIYYVPAGWGQMIMLGNNHRPMFLGIQSLSFIPWDVAGMTPAEYVYDLIGKMKIPDADLRRNVQPVQPKAGN